MPIEEKIKNLGISWPEQLPQPIANYETVRRSGNLLFLSGAGPPASLFMNELQELADRMGVLI
ncbi:hypothetical protein [Fictibacillus sp. NRS-1165]|uniref:hypothetical protein n=1 Tax=Fictibacillus sp. NRS-1165 TaxID=3144463 RepID=UPI003D1F309E